MAEALAKSRQTQFVLPFIRYVLEVAFQPEGGEE
jgi:hypothetical protein